MEILTQNSNVDNFIFESTEIRLFSEDGEIWFIAKEISDIRGYSETSKMLRRLDIEDKKTVARNGRSSIPVDIFGNQGSIIMINESGLYNAIFGSKLPIAKKFKQWVTKEVLPSIRKTGSYSVNNQDSFEQRKEKIELEIIGLKSATELLRVNEASKILMLSTLYKKLGLDTSYLPKYSDEQHTYSLSHLLKKFEVGISAKKLNLILLSEGYLEIKTRKSTGSFIDEKTKEKKPKLRTFKSLTEKGLEFGKNVISPHNQLETSPHYFEDKFKELIKSLKVEE